MCEATKRSAPQTNGVNIKGHDDYTNNKPTTTKPSALRRMTPLIISGYMFNTLAYFLVYALLPSDLSPHVKYCPENEPNCHRKDLFAFQVVSFFNLSFLGLLGVYTFYISKRASTAIPQTPQGRYFGNSLGNTVLLPEADYVNAVIVIFQGWDFVASIFFEEHCTMIMMTHHAAAFICGFGCLWYEVNPYCAVYIGGVSEFSSIFLCISQLFQYYPPSSIVSPSSSLSSTLSTIELVCQGMFVLTFFLFRIIGWASKSYIFFMDGHYIIKHGLLKRYAPGSGWLLWYGMFILVSLGALQVYWLNGIVNKVVEVMNT